MNNLIYPPSQKTMGLPVDGCEEEIASGDVAGCLPAGRQGKFRYHAFACGMFHLAILVFLISGCKAAHKREDGQITSKDMDKEFSDRRPLPDFHTEEKDTAKTHIDDKRYKTEDGQE
jgi:hypothetical protein